MYMHQITVILILYEYSIKYGNFNINNIIISAKDTKSLILKGTIFSISANDVYIRSLRSIRALLCCAIGRFISRHASVANTCMPSNEAADSAT